MASGRGRDHRRRGVSGRSPCCRTVPAGSVRPATATRRDLCARGGGPPPPTGRPDSRPLSGRHRLRRCGRSSRRVTPRPPSQPEGCRSRDGSGRALRSDRPCTVTMTSTLPDSGRSRGSGGVGSKPFEERHRTPEPEDGSSLRFKSLPDSWQFPLPLLNQEPEPSPRVPRPKRFERRTREERT